MVKHFLLSRNKRRDDGVDAARDARVRDATKSVLHTVRHFRRRRAKSQHQHRQQENYEAEHFSFFFNSLGSENKIQASSTISKVSSGAESHV